MQSAQATLPLTVKLAMTRNEVSASNAIDADVMNASNRGRLETTFDHFVRHADPYTCFIADPDDIECATLHHEIDRLGLTNRAGAGFEASFDPTFPETPPIHMAGSRRLGSG